MMIFWFGRVSNSDGSFSTKSAWDILCIRATKMQWVDWVWHPCLPKNISVMIWKAFHNALSVDDKLKRVGIPVVSKCDCCEYGGYEDQNHVLTLREFSTEIWNRATIQVGLNYLPGHSWRGIMNLWFQKAKKISQMGQLFALIPLIISCQLWLPRCKTCVEDIKESVDLVWWSIKYWIGWVGEKIKVGFALLCNDEIILHSLNILINPIKRKSVQVVHWHKPLEGRVKLNVDGSALNNPKKFGARGVIRNVHGDLITAFAVDLGHGSNNLVE